MLSAGDKWQPEVYWLCRRVCKQLPLAEVFVLSIKSSCRCPSEEQGFSGKGAFIASRRIHSQTLRDPAPEIPKGTGYFCAFRFEFLSSNLTVNAWGKPVISPVWSVSFVFYFVLVLHSNIVESEQFELEGNLKISGEALEQDAPSSCGCPVPCGSVQGKVG